MKKERKKERLEYLLKSEDLDYTVTQYDNGYYSFWINVPEKFTKDFSWVDLDSIDYQYCVDFIDELKHWDGTVKNNCIVYSSTKKECIDIVQAIASISNYKTHFNEYRDMRTDYERQTLYTIVISNKTFVGGENTIREEIDYDGYVYCVSVPSKMIVVRRDNTVLICGNTEHSVMSAGSKEGELETFRRLMNIYPKGILSVVSDTWDLWNVITNILPQLKEQILARDGKLVIRPDSWDPVDIICGYVNGVDSKGTPKPTPNNQTNPKENYEAEYKGVIELLWDIFGGTINEQGYKVLDSHIGALYGDSITLERANEICRRLEAKGFASTNIVLGIGSFTYQYNTRDTFGFAMKATYAERLMVDNSSLEGIIKGQEIFKNPVTDDGTKKSATGLLCVQKNRKTGEYVLLDKVSWGQEIESELQTIYEDGDFQNQTTLTEIRQKLNNN